MYQRKIIIFMVTIMFIPHVSFSAEKWDKKFTGSVGSYPAQMRISREGMELKGEYFYTRYRKPIVLQGKIDGDKEITLCELSEDGECSAEFSGELIKIKGMDFFQGVWKMKNGSKELPFSFMVISPENTNRIKMEEFSRFNYLPVTSDVELKLFYLNMHYDFQGFMDSEEKKLYWVLANSPKDNNPIFDTDSGHLEIGTPIDISPAGQSYQVEYMGFKMNSPKLIGDINVCFSGEYLCGGSEEDDESEGQGAFFHLIGIHFSRLVRFFKGEAVACGCGTVINRFGSSKLVFCDETNDIHWYRLMNPISLNKGANTSDEMAVGLQVYFHPSGSVGRIKIKLTNVILKRDDGAYAQARIKVGEESYRNNNMVGEFRAIIVAPEIGECNFRFDEDTQSLKFTIINKGKTKFKVDDLSLSRLMYALASYNMQWDGISFESFEGTAAFKYSSEDIKAALKDKVLEPQEAYAYTIKIMKDDAVPVKGLYFPVLEYVTSRDKSKEDLKQPVQMGRIITWQWIDRFPFIFTRENKSKIQDACCGEKALFYKKETGKIILVSVKNEWIKGPGSETKVLQFIPIDLKIMSEELSIPFFNYQRQDTEVKGLQWGIIMNETVEDYLSHQSVTGPLKEMKDLYGNRVVSYEGDGITVFLVNRQLFGGKGIRYQIPVEWKKESISMAVFLWMILSNPIG